MKTTGKLSVFLIFHLIIAICSKKFNQNIFTYIIILFAHFYVNFSALLLINQIKKTCQSNIHYNQLQLTTNALGHTWS